MHRNEAHKDQPALILSYTGKQRHWPLDRDAIILGRARGCDICLDSPDVSTLHCVVMRGVSGFTLRDCDSRSGTRLNGDLIQEAILHDCDVIQIGPFCFRVHLPAGPANVQESRQARMRHLERSRRHLAQLALSVRQRLRGGPPGEDLRRKASNLRVRWQTQVQRLEKLEEAERALSRDRELFAQEQLAHQQRVRQFEEQCRLKQERPAAAAAPHRRGVEAH